MVITPRGVARNLLGGQLGSGGRKSPAGGGPGAEYGNPREHQRGRDKNWLTVTGDMHPCPLCLAPDYAVQDQPRSPSLVPIESSYTTSCSLYLAPFLRYRSIGPNSIYSAILWCLTPPTEGFPSVKFYLEVNIAENFNRLRVYERCRHKRQTDGRRYRW